MRREDWLWLLLKAAGMYLVVVGIEGIPELLLAIYRGPGSEDATRLGPFLRAAVPVAGGVFLLLHRFPATTAAREPGASPAPTVAATVREDWLWVGFKLLGLYAVLLCLMQLLPYFLFTIDDDPLRGVVLGSTHLALNLGFGLWLVGGSRLWRWACR